MSSQTKAELDARYVWRVCGGKNSKMHELVQRMEKRQGPGSTKELREALEAMRIEHREKISRRGR